MKLGNPVKRIGSLADLVMYRRQELMLVLPWNSLDDHSEKLTASEQDGGTGGQHVTLVSTHSLGRGIQDAVNTNEIADERG